jgi:hypothetical protein
MRSPISVEPLLIGKILTSVTFFATATSGNTQVLTCVKTAKAKPFLSIVSLPSIFANDRYVIHLDYKKENNYYKNLKWATREIWGAHMLEDPNYKKTRAEFTGRGHKLTTERVKLIKKKLREGKTRMKVLAKQFGISEMQLYRIKVGINWAHVK